MPRLTKTLLVGTALFISALTLRVQGKPRLGTNNGIHPTAMRYYIMTKAMLITDETVSVFGASNLPAGSVLTVHVNDYIGEGSTTLNDEARAVVAKDGLFQVAIHPRNPLKFRTNMVCSVVFEPHDPGQPRAVINVVGPDGQHLGSHETNPEALDYPTGTLLVDYTVVRQ